MLKSFPCNRSVPDGETAQKMGKFSHRSHLRLFDGQNLHEPLPTVSASSSVSRQPAGRQQLSRQQLSTLPLAATFILFHENVPQPFVHVLRKRENDPSAEQVHVRWLHYNACSEREFFSSCLAVSAENCSTAEREKYCPRKRILP